MSIDYIFEYESVAKQHNLQILRLPEKIDLSNEKYAGFYAKASAQTSGKSPGEKITQKGTPTLYGVTIVKGAPHPKMAIAFVQYLLGSEGQKVIRSASQVPISPALVPNTSKVPKELSKLVKQGKGL
jgi:molybdate/tungstate transport system substrate-binding protein